MLNVKSSWNDPKSEWTEMAIAKYIFESFEKLESCVIKGFKVDGDNLTPRGEIVIKEIEALDKFHNFAVQKRGMYRKRYKPPDTIGDSLSHKTFKYQKTILESVIRYQIWRIQ
jgi:hypothetical protein